MRSCRLCLDSDPPLAFTGKQGSALPLFHEEGNVDAEVLFVMEAPNYDDTFDPTKRRLTVDPDTDPTGRFLCERLASELGLQPDDVMLTNSCSACRTGRTESTPFTRHNGTCVRPICER